MTKIVKAYNVQMSYQVSDAEKKQAELALLCFHAALKALQQASDHLNIMKTPFKDNPDINPDDIMQARAAVRRFRDKVIDNFNHFKEIAFKCIDAMQPFASDTQSIKLMKSMISSIDELEVNVNNFSETFNDLQSKNFIKDVVSAIEDIQEQCDDVEEIIEERVKPHIQNEILATSWVDAIGKDLQLKIEKQTPLIVDLYNQRQDQLNNVLKERGFLGN